MKIAIIGSRNITVKDIEKYASDAKEVVSGGAKGVDACAAEYAKANGESVNGLVNSLLRAAVGLSEEEWKQSEEEE